ncbi:hypothetical protein CYMTET_21175 [Cymbomonas tetramitiformis]|uniref:Uncharacterized protein n=1 Tax=Cymbomonas tetramitiformis TaxID=36881 RepID=A0AAE0G2P5_9CHLO|nr:hypothetical protein CYMTET_21175 [Cymbomonas tetramitiformis]
MARDDFTILQFEDNSTPITLDESKTSMPNMFKYLVQVNEALEHAIPSNELLSPILAFHDASTPAHNLQHPSRVSFSSRLIRLRGGTPPPPVTSGSCCALPTCNSTRPQPPTLYKVVLAEMMHVTSSVRTILPMCRTPPSCPSSKRVQSAWSTNAPPPMRQTTAITIKAEHRVQCWDISELNQAHGAVLHTIDDPGNHHDIYHVQTERLLPFHADGPTACSGKL